MCLTCGCWIPDTDHGDKANLTVTRLREAAAAGGVSLTEAAWNIPATLEAASACGWPGGTPTGNRPTVVFDIDGVLAFTAEALCTALNVRFGTVYSPQGEEFFPGTFVPTRLPAEQAQWLAAQMRDAVFVSGYAPDWHAMDTLRDAWDAGYQVLVATERPPELTAATSSWLRDWGTPPVEVHAVGHGNKPAFMAARYGPRRPAVLLDDNPSIQLTIARDGVQTWLPARHYNKGPGRDNVRRFTSWQQARYWLGLAPQP